MGVGLKESGSGTQKKWEWDSKKLSNTWMVVLDSYVQYVCVVKSKKSERYHNSRIDSDGRGCPRSKDQ